MTLLQITSPAVSAVASATFNTGIRVSVAELIGISTALIALLAFVFQYVKYASDRKKDDIEEGVRVEKLNQVALKVQEVEGYLHRLEDRINQAAPETAEMKNDIRHIMDALSRIEGKIDERGK